MTNSNVIRHILCVMWSNSDQTTDRELAAMCSGLAGARTGGRFCRHWCETLLVVLLLAISMFLNVSGLSWGLPSKQRSQFYPPEAKWYEAPNPTRLYNTAPYDSYNCDEGRILDGLSNMNPSKLDFNPHAFVYPSLSMYLTGATMKAADLLGFYHLQSSKDFYIKHPEKMAQLFITGRLVAVAMSVVGVLLLYLTVRGLFGVPTAILSSAVLATMPLWVRDSHFLLVNVPAAVWMIASAYCASLAMRNGSSRLLVISALLAGFAASTKYPAGAVLVLSFFVLLRQKRRLGRLTAWLLVVCAVGFLLGTPYSILAPREFLQDMHVASCSSGLPSPSIILTQLFVAQGTILALVTLCGLAIIAARLGAPKYQFLALWFLLGMAPRIISGMPVIRYILFGLPPLAIAAGIALNEILVLFSRQNRERPRAIGVLLCLLLIAPSAAYSLNIIAVMRKNDVRNIAADWLHNNIPAGCAIGISGDILSDMPPINANRYILVNLEQVKTQINLTPVIVLTSETSRKLLPDMSSYSCQTFSQRPSPLWTWPVSTWPRDWAFTFLDIHVYRKELRSGTPGKAAESAPSPPLEVNLPDDSTRRTARPDS